MPGTRRADHAGREIRSAGHERHLVRVSIPQAAAKGIVRRDRPAWTSRRTPARWGKTCTCCCPSWPSLSPGRQAGPCAQSSARCTARREARRGEIRAELIGTDLANLGHEPVMFRLLIDGPLPPPVVDEILDSVVRPCSADDELTMWTGEHEPAWRGPLGRVSDVPVDERLPRPEAGIRLSAPGATSGPAIAIGLLKRGLDPVDVMDHGGAVASGARV
jgi:hypothetical protein